MSDNQIIFDSTIPLGSSSSRLIIGNGCRHRLADVVAERCRRFVIISDQNVKEALGGSLFPEAPWLVVPAGEASKEIGQAGRLWSEMVSLGLDRSSAVVAVGGGVVGDLAGFVASTFMRGVPFYSLPTSLLAMVDASVGGKVGIDLPEGKNLVGQFYPADTVAVDPEVLSTLPASEWSAGMAEVIKHAILSGPELWDTVSEFGPADGKEPERLSKLVGEAVQVKVRVVREDPYERTGLRATLNLGHSYGHAIEWCSEFRMGHGQAVALGLLAGLRLSRAMGLLEHDFEADLLGVLKRWQLPTQVPLDDCYRWESLSAALGRDKKNKDGNWCFILPRKIGQVETVVGPPRELVREAFESLKGVPA